MQIKMRLLISYVAMLIIPIVLTVVAAIVIGIFYFGGFFNYNGVNFDSKNIESYIEKNSKDLEQVSIDASVHPESFKNLKYTRSIDVILNRVDSGIIVKEDNKYVYVSDFFHDTDLLKQLASVKWEKSGLKAIAIEAKPKNPLVSSTQSGANLNSQLIQIKDNLRIYTASRYRFSYDDNKIGYVYVVSSVDPLKRFVTHYFTTLVAVIILILILTNVILTYFVSRSITRPLYYLKKAANEIKNGNLNFEIENKSKDEIGELSSAFEEMRLKLKESIEMEQQYEQNRKELVSNISHDLKTPITAVKGYVEGIIDGVADTPDKMDKYIKTISAKTNEIDMLIDELFLYSKLDLKKLAFSFERVNIKKYLEHCVEDLSFDLESKGITLSYEVKCDDKTLVIADREKLNRVITNTVYNSVKYMDNEKGKIIVELEEEDNDVVVRIVDNGQGISESSLPYIFDRFYRADPARNTQKGGSGLGLSIAKHIIQEHGGRIWAQSKKGVGTTIAFTLKKTTEEKASL